jgi:surface antigen
VTIIGARRVYHFRMVVGEIRLRRVAGLAVAVALAVNGAACSLSYPMSSLVKDEEVTNSVVKRVISPLSPELGEEDWRRAKGAMALALDPQGSGSQVSWDNPDTLLKGNFTPVGQPFVKEDEVCRAFLATVVGQASTASLQGSACRPSGGEWTIKDVKPFKRA